MQQNTTQPRKYGSFGSSSDKASTASSLSTVTCYLCKQQGHYADKCPNKKTSSSSSPSISQQAKSALPNKGLSTHSSFNNMQRSSSASNSTTNRAVNSISTSSDSIDTSSSLSTVRINTLDRTIPPQVFIVDSSSPSISSHSPVIIVIDSKRYQALVDTGACTTCVDPLIPVTHGLTVSQVQGHVRMADINAVSSRIGTCTTSIQVIIPNRSTIILSHTFEILPLFDRYKGYHFILGRDLLYPLFHNGLSSSFFLPDLNSRLPQFEDPSLSSIVDAFKSLSQAASPSPSSSSSPSSFDALNIRVHMMSVDDGCITINDVFTSTISDDLKLLESHVHDTGAGTVASDEAPVRPSIISADSSSSLSSSSTTLDIDNTLTSEIKSQYSDKLHSLLTLLIDNESITGFCSLPETQVQLHIDESKRDKLYRRQYPIPHRLWSLADQVIQRWLDTGKITYAPVGCQYNLPLTIAPKKDDTGALTGIRVCLDTRVLNSILINNDKFQIPNIRETLETFANCSLFGEFDLSEAYLQFELHPDSRQYTAFTWNHVQYMFVGVPFGIHFIPSHFQRCISRLFHDLPFVISYFDNLPFGSSDWSTHIDQAISIINRLNTVNLRVKPSSVKIGRSAMKCLGHILSSQGIGIDPDKIAIIRDYPLPVTGEQMMQFLGLTGYVSSHIRHYAELSAPLQAVKFQKKIEWNDHMKHSFESIKIATSKAPFLQYPDFDRAFHLATDASNTGIGGVLYQPTHDNEHITANNIVAIHSRVLTETQRRYPAYKKELYGIVSSLRKFHSYIWGRDDLVIVTDHKPLTFILSSNQLSPALQQWLDIILDYSFTIQHRDGLLHVLPDRLSRLYSDVYTSSTWGIEPTPNAISSTAQSISDVPSSSQSSDIHTNALTRRQAFWLPVDTSSLPSPTETSTSSSQDPASETDDDSPSSNSDSPITLLGEETTNVVTSSNTSSNTSSSQSQSSSPNDDTLFHDYVKDTSSASHTDSDSEVKPIKRAISEIDLAIELEKRGKKIIHDKQERKQLIHDLHLQGHFGISAMFNKLWHLGYWWPKIRNEIQEELINCDACTRYNVTKSGYHPFTPITALGPGDHFQIDLSTHLPPSSDGYTTLLAVIDVFTGFVILRPLRDSSAETVARKLWKIFCLIGWPRVLQSDNGREFVNDILRALVKLTGIDHRLISPYNPRADGKVERVIGSTMMIIKKLLHGAKQNWSVYVPFAQVTFNDKITALTGSSPFSLMFGRSLNQLRDYTSDPETPSHISLDDWKTHQDKILSLIYPAIDDRIKSSKDKLAQSLTRHRRMLTSTSLPNGSTVMIKDQQRANKFEAKYIGPFIIVRRARNGAYVLKDTTGDLLDRHVPADQIKLVSKQSRIKDKDTFTVNKIIRHRGAPGSYEYLVDWKGYNEEHHSWEPESQFNDDQCITDYWKSLNRQRDN
jgi:hypothetical protein